MMRRLKPARDFPAMHVPRRARLAVASSAVLAMLGAGCAATTSPDFDGVFGDATRSLNAQQIKDPQAPQRNGTTLPPTDGRTVREAMDRQVEDYKSPPPTNVINIGVGGGNGR